MIVITVTFQPAATRRLKRLSLLLEAKDAIKLIKEHKAFLLPGTEAAIDPSILGLYNENLVVVIPAHYDPKRHGLRTAEPPQARK